MHKGDRVLGFSIKANSYISLNCWSLSQDTCVAECRVSWALDDVTQTQIWDLFLNELEPVGYNPEIIPGWDRPTSETFAVLRQEPWGMPEFPGSVLMGQGGEVLNWWE